MTRRRTRVAGNAKSERSLAAFTFAMLLDQCHVAIEHNRCWPMDAEAAKTEAASLMEHGLAFLAEEQDGAMSLVVDETGAYELARDGGDLKPFGEVIAHMLRVAGVKTRRGRKRAPFAIAALYIIRHDRDTRRRWNPSKSDYDEVEKPVHIHVYCFFVTRDAGLTLSEIALALGLDENQIEKPKRGKNALDNMLSYMTHIKYARKAQYDPSEVVTVIGRDYQDVYNDRREDWMRGRSAVARQAAALEVDDIIDRVRHGELTHDQLLLDDDLYEVYSIPANMRKVDDALAAWAKRRAAKAAAALRAQEFSTYSVYFYGKAGTGKSNLMSGIVDFLESEFGWQTARLAPSHAMDEYQGQEIVVLNDVRSGAMSAEDWLGLLDPHEEHTASARYQNKSHVAPRAIFITANKDPFELFYFSKGVGGGDRSESVDTFFRRLGAFCTVFGDGGSEAYNIVMRVPQQVNPYVVYAGVPYYGNDFVVSHHRFETMRKSRYYYTDVEYADRLALTWMFMNISEAGAHYSPYGAAYEILRAINASNDSKLFDPDDEGVYQRLFDAIDTRRAIAVKKGALLALPIPDDVDDLSDGGDASHSERDTRGWVDVFVSPSEPEQESEPKDAGVGHSDSDERNYDSVTF